MADVTEKCQVDFDVPTGCPMCELVIENKALATRAGQVTTVRRDTAATLEKLGRYADRFKTMDATASKQAATIRTQDATIFTAHNKLKDQAALVKSHEDTIASQETTDRILRAKIAELRGIAEALEEEVQALDVRFREQGWLIGTYRDKFAVMVDKIEDLTPECEKCVEGEALCPSYAGTGSKGARPDDCGIRFTCHRCNGSASVKCSECGKDGD